VTLSIESMAHGGEGVGREGGKVWFVDGAVAGDTVRFSVTEERARFGRGVVTEVVEPSSVRIRPPCLFFGSCGGCQWQMAGRSIQVGWKTETVRGQLAHVGGLQVEILPPLMPGPDFGYRNRLDLVIVGGRPAMRRRGSHEPVEISSCLLAAPSLADALAGLGTIDADRVTLRTGINTGEMMVLVDDQHGVIHEVVGGRRFRISDRAFFQNNTAGAEALVEVVSAAAGVSLGEVMVDAYAGGGLFAGCVTDADDHVIAIESDPVACSDLEHNVPWAEVRRGSAERGLARLDRADVIVVDPPRTGLGRAVVAEIVRLAPRRLIAVSCDPATFARDARTLVGAGFTLDWVQPIDLFPQTFHIETVASFTGP